MFETALVPIVEFRRMVTDPVYLEETGGYVRAGQFKVAVTSIVKMLNEQGDIAPDLATRLTKWTEDRHTLIHRWMLEHGWPDDNDHVGWAPIIDLANRVHEEATQLTKLLVNQVLKFADREWVANHQDEYRMKVARLFHEAHLEH